MYLFFCILRLFVLCTAVSPSIVLRVDLGDVGDDNIQSVLKETNILFLEQKEATSFTFLELIDAQNADMMGTAQLAFAQMTSIAARSDLST